MNIRDLKYLVTLAECQHFGKAAEMCFVSQPTLSMQIKKLEDELDVQLLERNNKSVMITPAGHTVVSYAKQILATVDQIKAFANSVKNPYAGDVKLGLIPTLGPYLLPHIVAKLHKQYPALNFYLVEDQTAKIVEKLKYGDLDVIILALPIDGDDFHIEPLFKEPFYLAVNQHHAWAKRKQIKQAELGNEKILLLEEGHCLRDQALEICNNNAAFEYSNFKATSLETLRHMIASGLGMTLMPKLACRKDDKAINYVPFTKPVPGRTIGMAWRKTTARHEVFFELSKFIGNLMT